MKKETEDKKKEVVKKEGSNVKKEMKEKNKEKTKNKEDKDNTRKVNKSEKTGKVNEKGLGINVVKGIVVILIVVIIAYLLIAFSKKDEDTGLKPAPNITIDYNLLNIERSDGNIVMEDSTYAQVKDGVKRNTSSKVSEEKIYNDLKIKEARIEAAGGMSQFIATVENPYDKNIQGEEVYIVFINEDGSEIARLETFFPDLEPNSTTEINIGTDIDITNAYDFYIEVK